MHELLMHPSHLIGPKNKTAH